jgi:hypothetical protein
MRLSRKHNRWLLVGLASGATVLAASTALADGGDGLCLDTNGDWVSDLRIDASGSADAQLRGSIVLDLDGDATVDATVNLDSLSQVDIATDVELAMDLAARLDLDADGNLDVAIRVVEQVTGAPGQLHVDVDGDGTVDLVFGLDLDLTADVDGSIDIDLDGQIDFDLGITVTPEQPPMQVVAENPHCDGAMAVDNDGDGRADVWIGLADAGDTVNGLLQLDLSATFALQAFVRMSVGPVTDADGVVAPDHSMNLDLDGDGNFDAVLEVTTDLAAAGARGFLTYDLDLDGTFKVRYAALLHFEDHGGVDIDGTVDFDGDGTLEFDAMSLGTSVAVDVDEDGDADVEVTTDAESDGSARLVFTHGELSLVARAIDDGRVPDHDMSLDLDFDGHVDVDVLMDLTASIEDTLDEKLLIDLDRDGSYERNWAVRTRRVAESRQAVTSRDPDAEAASASCSAAPVGIDHGRAAGIGLLAAAFGLCLRRRERRD